MYNLNINLLGHNFKKHLLYENSLYVPITSYWCNKLLLFKGKSMKKEFWEILIIRFNNLDLFFLESEDINFKKIKKTKFYCTSRGKKGKLKCFSFFSKEHVSTELITEKESSFFLIKFDSIYNISSYSI